MRTPYYRSGQNAADDGLSFGAPTTFETTVADKICELIPSVELIRMTSSGTEAHHVRHSSSTRLYRARQNCQI